MTTSVPIASTAAGAPIACTLGADDYADRLSWITALNRTTLRSHRRDGLALVLAYEPAAAANVRALVAREQECCAFLRFHVEEGPAAVRLTVVAPEATREALDAMFAPFLAGVEPARAGAADPPDTPPDDSPRVRAPGVAAGTAAVAALACGVCCVLPFAIPAIAVATVGGLRVTLRAMLAATALLVAAVGWPFVEPFIVRALQS